MVYKCREDLNREVRGAIERLRHDYGKNSIEFSSNSVTFGLDSFKANGIGWVYSMGDVETYRFEVMTNYNVENNTSVYALSVVSNFVDVLQIRRSASGKPTAAMVATMIAADLLHNLAEWED